MVRYNVTPANSEKVAYARGAYIRVHFKNTRETAAAIKGKSLLGAIKFLEDVKAHKRAVPFTRYNGGVGRTAQVNQVKGVTQGRWPVKSCEVLLNLLNNAKANATTKGLDVEKTSVEHIQINYAPELRRRTYRAHGRIGPYVSQQIHAELMVQEADAEVEKATDKPLVQKRKSKLQIAKKRTAAVRKAITAA
ncbi:60S ribosomal protein L17-A [Ramicandelaber brevisporus]|nr:60S ribosomal protein L17-A [Ramicandelaber brevisporus]